MDVISHPFRLAPTGAVATVLDGSTAANTEALAVLALTRKGERVLVPGFGIPDPVFDDVDVAEINAGVAMFGPEGVSVTGITITHPDARTASVRIEFEE